MALRSDDHYRASVADGRRIWYRGRPVADLRDDPDLVVALDHAAIDYELADDPEHRELAVDTDESGESFSAYYRLPRSAADLRDRSALIEAATAAGGTLVTLAEGEITELHIGLKGTMNQLFLKDLADNTRRGGFFVVPAFLWRLFKLIKHGVAYAMSRGLAAGFHNISYQGVVQHLLCLGTQINPQNNLSM